MTIQEYYELQAALQSLDTQVGVISNRLEDVRDVFNKIDVNLLMTGNPATAGTAAPQPVPTNSGTPLPPPTTGNSSTGTPVAQPKVRKKLNTPVITGPLGDVVTDMLEEKAAIEKANGGPVRLAPFEVLVKNVSFTPSGDYMARVEDVANKSEAYVEISKQTFEEFNRDPDGLVIELNGYTLQKTEWLPIEESPMSIVTTAVTEV